tara:strand:- start:8790 stop:12818 length:4029 start_codon:yes stop_codon:yes gene_type:complete
MKHQIQIRDADGNVKLRHSVKDGDVIPVEPGDIVFVLDDAGTPATVTLLPIEGDLRVEFQEGNSVILKDYFTSTGYGQEIIVNVAPDSEAAQYFERFSNLTGSPDNPPNQLTATSGVEPGNEAGSNPARTLGGEIGNLPPENDFTLMRLSNLGYTEFRDTFSAYNDDLSEALTPDETPPAAGFGGSPNDGPRTNSPLPNESAADNTVDTSTSKTSTRATTTESSTGDSDSTSPTVEVTTVSINYNLPPNANDDAASTNEDTLVANINVLENDTAAPGETLTVTSATAVNGTVTINPDGTLNYTPNANFNGTDTIIYKISDSNGSTSAATVTVTVNPVDDEPIAVNDTPSMDEDSVLNGDLSTNDTLGDGANLFVKASDPSNGTVVVNTNGTFTYTPNADFYGTDSFTYTLTDADGDESTATATITVNPTDDLPSTTNDTLTIDEDNSGNGDVSTNDTLSADGGNTFAKGSDPSNGSVVVNADGTYTYTPNANYNGSDSFTYTLTDTDGDVSTATVNVTINSVDDFPEAVNDTVSTDEDIVLNGDLSSNDTLSGDGGNTYVKTSDTSNGTLVVNTDGTYAYTPNANFNGTDSFSYSLTDADGDVSNATVNITIDAVNDAPTAVDDSAATGEDLGVQIDVLPNDSDQEEDSFSIAEINGVTATVGVPVGLSSGATATLMSDGTIYYDPNGTFDRLSNGETASDSFTYGAGDVHGDIGTATINVTITGYDDAVNNNAFQVTSGQLNYLAFDPALATFVNQPIGSVSGSIGNYNAMAFNSVDSQIYAISDTDLIQVDPETGASSVIGSGIANGEYVGEFNPADGYLYAKRGNTDSWSIYDVQNGTKVGTFDQSESATFHDIAYDPVNNLFWAALGSTVYSMTMDGTITSFANAIPLHSSDGSAWGGAFSDANGNVAILNNDSGRIYSVNTITGEGTYLAQGNPSGQNDGAADPTVANDLFRPHVVLDQDSSTGGKPHAAYARFVEGGDAVNIADSDGYVTDFNSANLEGMTITLTNAQTGDVLNSTGIPASISAVASSGAGTLTITLTGTASLADYTTALQAITFENTESSPSITPRFIEVTATDGTGVSSEAQMTIFVLTAAPPVVIDLDGDGVEFLSAAEGIRFDIDGDGAQEQTAWAHQDDAVLVYDSDQDGQISGKHEVSFTDYVDGAKTDMEGLLYFDSDSDQVLSAADSEFESFKIWQDADGDGMVSEGELRSLTEAGIESIGLVSDGIEYTAADGDVLIHGESIVRFADGTESTAADAQFVYHETSSQDLVEPEGSDAPLEVITDDGTAVNLDSPNQTQGNIEALPQEPAPTSEEAMGEGTNAPVPAMDDAAAAAAAAA